MPQPRGKEWTNERYINVPLVRCRTVLSEHGNNCRYLSSSCDVLATCMCLCHVASTWKRMDKWTSQECSIGTWQERGTVCWGGRPVSSWPTRPVTISFSAFCLFNFVVLFCVSFLWLHICEVVRIQLLQKTSINIITTTTTTIFMSEQRCWRFTS